MFLLFAFHEYMVLLFVLAKPFELVFYNQQLKKKPFLDFLLFLSRCAFCTNADGMGELLEPGFPS